MISHPAGTRRSTRAWATEAGSVRWKVDEHASWKAPTWVALVITASGTALAVFGLLPLNIHGPLHFLGIMDPLCGATRAARLALRGNLIASWHYNPIGAPLVVVCLLLVSRAAVGWTYGRWVSVKVMWSRKAKLVLMGVSVLLVTALEVNQQMHAALLMLPR